MKPGTDSELLDFDLGPLTLQREEALRVLKCKINLFLMLSLGAQETTDRSMQPQKVLLPIVWSAEPGLLRLSLDDAI